MLHKIIRLKDHVSYIIFKNYTRFLAINQARQFVVKSSIFKGFEKFEAEKFSSIFS